MPRAGNRVAQFGAARELLWSAGMETIAHDDLDQVTGGVDLGGIGQALSGGGGLLGGIGKLKLAKAQAKQIDAQTAAAGGQSASAGQAPQQ